MRSSSLIACATACIVAFALDTLARGEDAPRAVWTKEQAQEWQRKTGWLVGCNYIPRTAINQLEMWQVDTFDPETIEQELKWAADLGLNSMRVFLHHQLWEQDPQGFTDRIDQYLKIAHDNGISTVFVLFDDVWDPQPQLGPQREPAPFRHNSGWVQSPGAAILRDDSAHEKLRPYVDGILKRFGNDDRIVLWDLYNEPGNSNGNSYGKQELPDKGQHSLHLLRSVFEWARAANPSQPLTVGVWTGEWVSPGKPDQLSQTSLDESDVISFHGYDAPADFQKRIDTLLALGRPIVCTEYLARGTGNRFETILPLLKENGIGAFNWGFVSGKTQTIYPWDSWQKEYRAEPRIWHHDIVRSDGTPHDPDETALLRELTRPQLDTADQ